jgi:predicted nucleotidyltransferase
MPKSCGLEAATSGTKERCFDLTYPVRKTTLAPMTKQEIICKLAEAIRRAPYFTDIKSVALFGSHVNGTPTEDSDVDVLIDFEPNATIGFFALSDIKDFLETALGEPIDLLTPQAISKYFRAKVLAQAETIYER